MPARPKLGFVLTQRGHSTGSSGARALLNAGRVTVNGEVETSFSRRVAEDMLIRVDSHDQDGESSAAPHLVVWCKPCGLECTTGDSAGRANLTAAAIAPDLFRAGLHVVGRLDAHSCGLMLWTTDGRLTRALIDPANAVPREYECVVRGPVDAAALRARLRDGVAAPRFGPEAVYYAQLVAAGPFDAAAAAAADPRALAYEHAGCATDDRRDDGPGPFRTAAPILPAVPVGEGAGAGAVAGPGGASARAAEGDGPEAEDATGAPGRHDAAAAAAAAAAADEEDAEAKASEAAEVAAAAALSVVRVVVCEGKHRMVRRMLAHCGHPVVNLKRRARLLK